jgi:hypothetical protein
MYLTIPEITESEEIIGLTAEDGGLSFRVVLGAGETTYRLQRAGADGEHLPLVVLATDAQVFALHSVYVSGFSVLADAGGTPLTEVTFLALEVEMV